MPEANPFLLFTRGMDTLGARYMVTGSVAVILYGEPRLTHDIDLVVVLDRAHIARLHDIFPSTEFYCPPEEIIVVESRREQRGHFNLVHSASGFKADVYIAGSDPLHAWGLANVRRIEFEGPILPVAPPEYVIVRKLEYFREGSSEKHLRDIRSILAASGDLIARADLDRFIGERGLEKVWQEAQSGM
ncbi:MAG: hypothetical protein AAB353_01970 [Candidatus Hydrogenedentota bacterium]